MFSYVESQTSSIQQASLMNVPQSYEKSDQKPLKDIPLTITLNGASYLLAALILFAPPSTVTGLGHYTAAVRVNDRFEIFDDLRTNTYTIDNNLSVCIHSLLYVERKK